MISKFSQCIISGRDSMLIALLIIAVLGCIVRGHHMFMVGFDLDYHNYWTSRVIEFIRHNYWINYWTFYVKLIVLDYLGRIHSSSFFMSSNSIFFTMHSLGIIGFPRRIYDYSMIFFKFQ